MSEFTVALIGRPNVGKSTLFNRLVGKKLAIVDDAPGVTRDRREGNGRIGDLKFRVIDTAGLEEASDESLAARMRSQTDRAIAEADLTLFLIDARAGVTPMDEHFADALRKSEAQVRLVANKCEGAAGLPGLHECYRLGLGDPAPISAEHGEGMGDLFEIIDTAQQDWAALVANASFDEAQREQAEDLAPPSKIAVNTPTSAGIPEDLDPEAVEELLQAEAPPPKMKLTIVGRPNVGKSTLINTLLAEERLLTGPEAGVTRDSIAVDWVWRGRPMQLVDTAGLRRKARVSQKVEKLSAADTLRAIRFAHVVVLLLDAEDMLEKQDLTIARQVLDEGRALIIAANKWDIVEDRNAALQKLRDRIQTSLPQAKGIPVVTVSAKTGDKLNRLLDAAGRAYDLWNTRVPTGPLNKWLMDVTDAHPPPLARGRRIKLRYITQAKTRPPTFVIFASIPETLPESYSRYLTNALREDFDMPGTPIRLLMRRGKNPFAPQEGARGRKR